MAKPNVHTASRDELAEAGVRAELVDEILKRRRRKGGLTLEALGEVQGVGPATLEQLGKTLDFKEPPRSDEANDKPQPSRTERPVSSGRGDDDQTAQNAPQPAARELTDAAEATRRAGTEQAADLVAAAVQAGAAATRGTAGTMRHTVEAAVRAADQGARAGLQVVQRTAEAAEGARHEAVERPAEDASAFGRSFLELLQEQGRENMAAMAALARARDLDEVIRLQGGYLRGSLERMTELNRRWLELAGTMWPGVAMDEDRGRGPSGGGKSRAG